MKHRALTLVEILIVLIILGILVAIVIPQFGGCDRMSHGGVFNLEGTVVFYGTVTGFQVGEAVTKNALLVKIDDGSLFLQFPTNLTGLKEGDKVKVFYAQEGGRKTTFTIEPLQAKSQQQ